MNTIEVGGPRLIADEEFPIHSLFDVESQVVAFRLTKWTGDMPVPKVLAFAKTARFYRDIGEWVDNVPLVPLEVTDVRIEGDGPSAFKCSLVFKITSTETCDPMVALIDWRVNQ